MQEQEENLTIEEVANWLRISTRSVINMANAGTLPSFRVLGRRRFKRSAIQRYIEQQEAQEEQKDDNQ